VTDRQDGCDDLSVKSFQNGKSEDMPIKPLGLVGREQESFVREIL
jgi:hypothetical protein